MVLPVGTWKELNYIPERLQKFCSAQKTGMRHYLTLLSTVSLAWCALSIPTAESSLSADQHGHTWRESADPKRELVLLPLFPSAYSFRAWHQNNVTGTSYSIVQTSSLFAVQKEVFLYSQGAGVCCLRENLLQTMKNKRERGIKNFPVMLLNSISSSSWAVV